MQVTPTLTLTLTLTLTPDPNQARNPLRFGERRKIVLMPEHRLDLIKRIKDAATASTLGLPLTLTLALALIPNPNP